jgi:hypothetical protein
MNTNTQTTTAPLSKDQALKKYDKATRLRWRSPISEWRAAFPTLESLAEFRRDVGNLSWPGSYGQSPWDDAFSLAYNLGAGISESSRRYMLDNADCDWGRQMLAVYAEYGLKVEPSPAPVVAPAAESSPLVPLSAPVGVSGVTLPAAETSKATLTFASYETAKEFRTAWTRFSKRGTSLSPRNANGGATLDLWGVTEDEKPWIAAKIADLGGNAPSPAPESVTAPATVQPVAVPDTLLIGSYRRNIGIDSDTSLTFETGENVTLRTTVGEVLEAVSSHAANLAKIKTLEEACNLLIREMPFTGKIREDFSRRVAVEAGKKALALPSA